MKDYLPLIIIALCLPFVLWGVCDILPTFDDYTSLQSPWQVQIADPGYFFSDAVRRPFDYLLGLVVGHYPTLFPTLNHVLIILGHTASTTLVFVLCRRLRMSRLATNVATLFFFFSPATLGATLACDGFNQTYAQLWGLLALYTYLRAADNCSASHATANFSLLTIPFYIICLVMAALSKENGLAWTVVPPIVAYGFELVSRRTAMRHVGVGLLLAVTYIVVYAIISFSGVLNVAYDEQYSQATLLNHLKDFVQLMAYTWVPLDYMSAVYPPTRNWFIVAATALMALPFLIVLTGRWRQLKSRRVLALVVCFFILVSPHLVTLVSIMHNYAALSLAALVVAGLISSQFTVHSSQSTVHSSQSTVHSSQFTVHSSQFTVHGLRFAVRGSQFSSCRPRMVIVCFSLFLAAALFTDVRHYLAARQSGLLGKQLAMQVVSQAEKPVARAFCINIDDDSEPRYSNFCVRPVDAFAWGLSVRHYTGYTWKTAITEVTLKSYDQKHIDALADSALLCGNEAVWVVGHDRQHLKIISPSED